MFTNRFIKIPIVLYNTKEADIVGYDESTKNCETVMFLSPFEISHYRPSFNDDSEMTNTLIHMKSGDSFNAEINIKEFEKLLDAF